jgi:hypothetical protein
MPELGKATYVLTVNSSQFNTGLAKAEAEATAATNNIARGFGMVAKSEVAAGEAGAAAASGVAAAGAAAATAGAAAGRSGALWGKAAMRIEAAGRAGHMAGFIGLGAAYFALEGGIHYLKESNEGWLKVSNAIEATGGVAGVTGEHAKELSEHMTKLTGTSAGANYALENMLLRFTNIRNLGPGLGMVFDRTIEHVQNISIATGKSTKAIGIALGKAMQDPAKYLGILGRSGVTFTDAQKKALAAMEATNGIAAAQAELLHILDTRYGGLSTHTESLAEKTKKSLNTQLRIAKDTIDEAAASLVTSFIPAVAVIAKGVAHFAGALTHVRKPLMILVVALVGLKVAAIAARIALGALRTMMVIARTATLLYAVATNRLSIAQAVAAVKAGYLKGAVIATSEAEVIATGTTKAFAGSLGKAGLYGMLVAASFGISTLILRTTHLDKIFKKAGGWAYDFAAKLGLVSAGISDASANAGMHMADPKVQEQLRAAYEKAKNAPDLGGLRDKIVEQMVGKGYTYHDAEVFAGKAGPKPGEAPAAGEQTEYAKDPGKSGTIKKPKVKAAKAPKAPKAPAVLSSADILGAGFVKLDIKMAQAERTKKTADDRAVLREEMAYINSVLRTRKLSLEQRRDLEQQLTGIDQQIKGMEETETKKKKKAAGVLLLSPAQIRINIAKAERTKGKADDLKAWNQEKAYLEDQLKHKKHTLKERARIQEELTRVEKQILALKKKGTDAAKQMRLREMQAAMDLRGSFFSQFASSIFHRQGGGDQMAMGNGKTMNYHQTNHYNEIPRDKFATSRQMRLATSGAWD